MGKCLWLLVIAVTCLAAHGQYHVLGKITATILSYVIELRSFLFPPPTPFRLLLEASLVTYHKPGWGAAGSVTGGLLSVILRDPLGGVPPSARAPLRSGGGFDSLVTRGARGRPRV